MCKKIEILFLWQTDGYQTKNKDNNKVHSSTYKLRTNKMSTKTKLTANNIMENIGNGEFTYIINPLERKIMNNAWQAVTHTDSWEFMANEYNMFTDYNSHPKVRLIFEKMKSLGHRTHSRDTFCACMRYMHNLAFHGESVFEICIVYKQHYNDLGNKRVASIRAQAEAIITGN
jgi:hypothetical protein